ncbi:class A beta-lactamase-related serine hydrolase [Sabulilitoribacter multivorans]|uniref:beta-lactamase n=1 Tax=Flaviramulus multivorans TaxID=1304750 RepID=A0ABS9IK19_9FLAO|nr:serine hydrolase [Flaviramulus multivorans]MCF7560933.1 class A beta-lactamase-related serine hydrolase [Flaviramulus multivorans]
MKNKVYCLLMFIGISFVMHSQKGLPIQVPNSKIQPLTSLADKNLQNKLTKELNANPKWKSLMANKKMAIGVVDLSDPEQIKYASINGNHMMYAASLPKIAILLAAMDAIDKGELKETAIVKTDMRLMISKSDNRASTRMIDRLGYAKIESVMTDPKYKFYDEGKGGGLWVGKRYGGGGNTNREPLKNLSHAATVSQVCRYYYLLAHGKLVNEKRSKQMLDIMGDPDLHHKFVNTVEKIAPNAKLFRKSGSWRSYHSDSILVWGNDPERRYILVALIDDADGEHIIRSLVKPIEKALKASSVETTNNVVLN